MRSPHRALIALSALPAAALLLAWGAAGAHAQETPGVGGSVPSLLGLSIGEPSELTRTSATHGSAIYTATIPVQVTATDVPTRLSISDGETISRRRRGHLVKGGAILTAPLQAAAAGPFHSLQASVDPLLEHWLEPVSSADARIRLRQRAPGGAGAIRGYHKLLLITITSAVP